MVEDIQEEFRQVKEYITKIEELNSLWKLAFWDMNIVMPKKALNQRANTLGFLSGEIYKLSTSEEVRKCIEYFNPIIDKLTLLDKVMVKETKKKCDEIKKLPENLYREFTIEAALSHVAWEEARKKNDFKIFEPHLEKMVYFKRKFAEYYGYGENKYEALLNQYEPGMTVSKLEEFFEEIKIGILDLLDYIKHSNKKINVSNLTGTFEIEKQKKLSIFLLNLIKFDLEAGRLDEDIHPFTIGIYNKDVRIVTRYYENMLLNSINMILHEGGHGLYEQHISDKLKGTGLNHAASIGIHESQSRFYQNIIGRSKEFLSVILPLIKNEFKSLKNIKLDKFYNEVNYVKSSLIRTEADEITFNFHIFIRYEIEKSLINGEIEVKDLPRIWNEKYKEYLGIEPTNDNEGILQDIHWAAGDFGYFPCYILGNIYGGQLLNKILEDNKNAIKDLIYGDLTYIDNWLRNKVQKYGAIYKPEELIMRATGKEISTKYFLEYLERKYKNIY